MYMAFLMNIGDGRLAQLFLIKVLVSMRGVLRTAIDMMRLGVG